MRPNHGNGERAHNRFSHAYLGSIPKSVLEQELYKCRCLGGNLALRSGGINSWIGQPDNRKESVSNETRAADQRAVDVRLVQQGLHVFRFGTAAVLDGQSLGRRVSKELRKPPAHEYVGLLRLLRRGNSPRINRPDRLVSNHQPLHLVLRQVAQSPGYLVVQHRLCLIGFAVLQSLTDAEDHVQTALQRKLHFGIDQIVLLTHQCPPLAVADNDIFAAGVEQHAGTDFSREGALGLRIDVLSAEGDRAALQDFAYGRQPRKWRAQGNGHAIVVAQSGFHRGVQRSSLAAVLIHLPVAGDELLACHNGTRQDENLSIRCASLALFCQGAMELTTAGTPSSRRSTVANQRSSLGSRLERKQHEGLSVRRMSRPRCSPLLPASTTRSQRTAAICERGHSCGQLPNNLRVVMAANRLGVIQNSIVRELIQMTPQTTITRALMMATGANSSALKPPLIH